MKTEALIVFVSMALAWSNGLSGGSFAEGADCSSPTHIRFKKGANDATAHGGVIRAEEVCYVFDARAGQKLTVNIASPDQNVAFTVYAPGYHVVPAKDGPDISGRTLPGAGDQDDAMSLNSTLSASGRYLFVLGTVRGGGGEYSLHVQVR